MNYLHSESRARHAYVEAVVDETLNNLENNNGVATHMDDTMRARLMHDINYSFVPNVRNGIVSIPKPYRQKDATPIVATKRDETLMLGEGFGAFSPRQEAAILDQGIPMMSNYLSDINGLLAKNERSQDSNARFTNDNHATAYVGNIIIGAVFSDPNAKPQSDTPAEWHLRGRPFVGLFADRNGTFKLKASSSGTLVHEFVHVTQDEGEPIRPSTSKLETYRRLGAFELEAYHHAHNFEKGLFESNDPFYSDNIHVFGNNYVEQARLEFANPNLPFRVSNRILEKLIKIGVFGPMEDDDLLLALNSNTDMTIY